MKTVTKFTSIILSLIICSTFFSLSAFALNTENGITYVEYGSGYAVDAVSLSAGKNVVIPSEYNGKPVVAVSKNASKSNSKIETLSIPETVTSIGDYAFSDCPYLKSVSFAAGAGNVTLKIQAFAYCPSLTEVTLPSLTVIPPECFKSCTSLSAVVIPDSTVSIAKESFMNTALTQVSIPAEVSYIGDSAFFNCASLKSFTADENNEYFKAVDGVLFSKDGKELVQYPIAKTGTSYTVPAGTEEIGNGAFGFSSLKTVSLPSGLTYIGSFAFSNCNALSTVNLPEGVETIGANAFLNCSALKTATLPASLTSYDTAFVGSGLETVTIKQGASKISANAFKDCKSLTSVEIPDSVTSIDYGAFYGCENLGDVYIPASVTSIGNSAFYGCNAVKLIVEKDSYAETYAVNNSINYEIKTEPQPEPEMLVYIKGYMKKRIEGYKTSVTFHANVKAPEGYTLYWVVDNKEYKDSGSLSYKVASATNTYTIKCKVVYGDYSVESDTETVNISTGLFAKIAYFFRSIFAPEKLNVDQI